MTSAAGELQHQLSLHKYVYMHTPTIISILPLGSYIHWLVQLPIILLYLSSILCLTLHILFYKLHFYSFFLEWYVCLHRIKIMFQNKTKQVQRSRTLFLERMWALLHHRVLKLPQRATVLGLLQIFTVFHAQVYPTLDYKKLGLNWYSISIW